MCRTSLGWGRRAGKRRIEALEAERRDEYLAWRAGTFTPRNAETWETFRARVAAAVRDCLKHCAGDTLAVVHGGVIRAACHEFLGLPPSRVVPVTPGSSKGAPLPG